MTTGRMLPLVIISGIVIGLGATGFYLYTSQNKKVSPSVADGTISVTPTKIPVELVAWKDPAGFQFQYPKDITINPHTEDTQNYAHVELTHKDHPGNLIVWMKDLPVSGGKTISDVAFWVKNEKRFAGANILDTTLGKLPAKKILLTQDGKQVWIISAIDTDVLVTIEALSGDDTYWQDVHKTIADTFMFGSTTAADPTADGDDAAYEEPADEEEVLE